MPPLFKILSVCKGGGYRYCRTDPPHPKRNTKGLYPLHRVLAENKIGRLLRPGETVHHEDDDKTNDNLVNLEVKDHAEHSREHALKRAPEPVTVRCPCGTKFRLRPCDFRLRRKRAKGPLHCSRACYDKITRKKSKR